jgi:hypothetical protein
LRTVRSFHRPFLISAAQCAQKTAAVVILDSSSLNDDPCRTGTKTIVWTPGRVAAWIYACGELKSRLWDAGEGTERGRSMCRSDRIRSHRSNPRNRIRQIAQPKSFMGSQTGAQSPHPGVLGLRALNTPT